MTGACPLCGAVDGDARERIAFADVWEDLRQTWQVELAPETRAALAPADDVELRRCHSCGVDWFVGAVAGDGRFYAELMAAAPYVADRWEFTTVAARLNGHESVVDFGGGVGHFLRSLDGRVGRRVIVDHNEDAVRTAREAGLEAEAATFEDFADRNAATFDVASAFQIAEHVEDVQALLRPVVRCLAGHGRLFVSVPDRERMQTTGLESLDCPPHHMTRWSAAQLTVLAELLDLDLVRVDRQSPDYGAVAAVAMGPFDRRVNGRGAARRLARGVVRRVVIGERRHELAARAGLLARAGLHGHTMLAELRRRG